MSMAEKGVLLICLGLTAPAGCRDPQPPAPAKAPSPSHITVDWPEDATCRNEAVNRMVRSAIEHCTAGNYQEYRLLWSYKHKPASRKRFEQLWRAVERVEVKSIKKLLYRLSDETIASKETPEYVLHAFVEISKEAREQSGGQLDDRNLILLIIKENDDWRFLPAPKVVKKAVLAAAQEAEGPEISLNENDG